MEINKAVTFIKPAIEPTYGLWADIGAGSGVFTKALDQLLKSGSDIYAIDKKIESLKQLSLENSKLHVLKYDFSKPLDLPLLDGILMANSLHYIEDQIKVLKLLLDHLKPDGTFVLIEYEIKHSRSPWVPYPISIARFQELAKTLPLTVPQQLGKVESVYRADQIYVANCKKTGP